MVLFNQAHRNRNKAGGFTLIELMIVIAVIGIIAVFGTPKYQGIKEQYRLENSAQALIAELKYAKQLAMDQRRTTYVLVEADRVRVVQRINEVVQEFDSKPFDQGVNFNSAETWMELRDDDEPFLIGHGVSYNNKGFVTNSRGGTIWLSSNNHEVGVEIEAKTGYISVSWP